VFLPNRHFTAESAGQGSANVQETAEGIAEKVQEKLKCVFCE